MEDGLSIGARDLVLAIFRLAVADYLGAWYGHDEPGPQKETDGRFSSDAETFLRGSWAAYLGDIADLEAGTVWRNAQRVRAASTNIAQAA